MGGTGDHHAKEARLWKTNIASSLSYGDSGIINSDWQELKSGQTDSEY
jgi:hypothetical protein